MPPIPRPEPLDALRARYPAALAQVFDAEAIVAGQARPPSKCAANVFDFEDGLRLIVYRERGIVGTILLHVSASFSPVGRLAEEMRRLALTMSRRAILKRWRDNVPRRFVELSGDRRELTFGGWTVGHVPHFAVEEAPPDAGEPLIRF